MRLSLTMPLHRAVEFDYPAAEVCRSVFPLIDEAVLVVSPYPDGTWELCEGLQREHPNVRLIRRDWWDEARGCEALADATNVGIAECRGQYVLNLQADEVLHEGQAPALRSLCDGNVLWAELGRLNFHGRFDAYNANTERWPCSVVRLMRRDLFPTVRSYGDATHLGWMERFDPRRHPRRDARGLVDLWHYAYVRPGAAFVERQANMARLYGRNPDPAIEAARETQRVDWKGLVPQDEFVPIPVDHPAVMTDWIARRRAAVENGAWQL